MLYKHLTYSFYTKGIHSALYHSVGFLRCLFSERDVAKARNMERTSVRFPRFLIYCEHHLITLRESGAFIYRIVNMIHAGQLIRHTLHEQGRTVTWFAAQLCCTRPNVYKIFRKENIDIHLLWRISCILGHNFFQDLSKAIHTESLSS